MDPAFPELHSAEAAFLRKERGKSQRVQLVLLGPSEALGGQVPPARKGRVEWGHLAGAWEPDDFRGLSEARKLKLSSTGGWGSVVQGRSPQGHLGGAGVGRWPRVSPVHCVIWACFPAEPQGEGAA